MKVLSEMQRRNGADTNVFRGPFPADSEATRVRRPGDLVLLTVPGDEHSSAVPGYGFLDGILPRLAACPGAWYNRDGERLHALSKSAWESILVDAGLASKTMIHHRYVLGRVFGRFGGGESFREPLRRVERSWRGA